MRFATSRGATVTTEKVEKAKGKRNKAIKRYVVHSSGGNLNILIYNAYIHIYLLVFIFIYQERCIITSLIRGKFFIVRC